MAGINANAPVLDELAVSRLRLLASASEALGEAGLDLTSVLRAIAHAVTQHMAECSAVTLLSETDHCFDVVTVHDRDEDARRMLEAIYATAPRLPADQGVLGRVMREQRAVLLPVVDPSWMRANVSDAYRAYVAKFLPRSMVVVPIRARGKLLGTFSFVRRTGEAFTEADADLASEIATRAGLAIENARLYTQAEAARARMQVALAAAEAAVRARDNVLAVVSHDLRNSLAVIGMAAAQLGEDAPHADARRGGMILRASARMKRLIDDLLDVAQIDAGALTVDMRPYHLPTLLAEAGDVLAPLAAQKEQEIVVSPCDVRIRVDRGRFLQVMSNLVGNASKFAPPRTKIHVEAAVTDEGVEVSVTDEGKGIPEEALATVFDRFVQAAKESARRQGVGLGLAIVRGIVAAHGARVVAENAPPRGARVRILFPAVTAATAPTADDLAKFLGTSPSVAAVLLASARDSDSRWVDGPAPGVRVRALVSREFNDGEEAFLVRIAPEATYPMHTHDAKETILILDGGLRDDDGAELWPGDVVDNLHGTSHSSTALASGCLLVATLRRP